MESSPSFEGETSTAQGSPRSAQRTGKARPCQKIRTEARPESNSRVAGSSAERTRRQVHDSRRNRSPPATDTSGLRSRLLARRTLAVDLCFRLTGGSPPTRAIPAVSALRCRRAP